MSNCPVDVLAVLQEAREVAWSLAQDRFEHYTSTFITKMSFNEFMEQHEADLNKHICEIDMAMIQVECNL